MRKTTQLTAAVPRRLPSRSALLAFERAATQQSFRRAAKDLALSPSAISHHIRGLEELLGVRLFARAGRTVKLTVCGERYLQSISTALGAIETASRDLMRDSLDPAELRISSLPFFTGTVLIPAIAEFERRNPLVTLRIEATHQYADFDKGGVDVAIRYGRERASGLKLEALIDVQSLPVCAPSLCRNRLEEITDLRNEILIHISSQPRAWALWCDDVGMPDLEPRGNLWFDTVPTALEAAEHGLGVVLAMHPLIYARQGFGKTLIAPFPNAVGPGGTFYLATRPEQHTDKHITEVRRWIVSAVELASGSMNRTSIL